MEFQRIESSNNLKNKLIKNFLLCTIDIILICFLFFVSGKSADSNLELDLWNLMILMICTRGTKSDNRA